MKNTSDFVAKAVWVDDNTWFTLASYSPHQMQVFFSFSSPSPANSDKSHNVQSARIVKVAISACWSRLNIAYVKLKVAQSPLHTRSSKITETTKTLKVDSWTSTSKCSRQHLCKWKESCKARYSKKLPLKSCTGFGWGWVNFLPGS